MSPGARIGLIGGSGVYDLEALADLREERVETPFGAPSDSYFSGTLWGRAGRVSVAARAGSSALAHRDQLPRQRLWIQDARLRCAPLGFGLREPARGVRSAPGRDSRPVHRPDPAPRGHLLHRRRRRARESRRPGLSASFSGRSRRGKTRRIDREARRQWKYSDPNSTELRLALSRQANIAVGKIVIGNGSEDLIAVICRACLDKGDRVVTVHPSFLLHEIYPAEQGAHVITIPMNADFSFNIDGLISELERGCKMLIFSNPSNPVGTMIDSEGFSRICKAASPDTVMVVDEAYYEYAAALKQFPDSLSILGQRHNPYAVLRTFSKAYGLAGLRVGYGYFSDTRFADHINKLRTPFNVNSLAQIAARAALEDKEHLAKTIRHNSRERSRVSTELRRHGYRVAESQGNFIFLDTGHNSSATAERLLAQGIIVKPWAAKGYENFLRVTIGAEKDNSLFLKHFIG